MLTWTSALRSLYRISARRLNVKDDVGRCLSMSTSFYNLSDLRLLGN